MDVERVLYDISRQRGRLYAAGVQADAIALHPDTWAALETWARATMEMYPNVTGAPRSLLGMAVYLSPLVPPGTAYLGSVAQIEDMLHDPAALNL